MKKCLREVPGVTGADRRSDSVSERDKKNSCSFCDTTDGKKIQLQTVSQVRPTVRRIRTVPDGTVGEGCANGVNESTINTQHGQIGVGASTDQDP